jgi:DNA-binding YbaB/EbfC family protein
VTIMATNPFEIFKQLQGLQSKMGEIQAKLKTVRATGSAAGGLVTVEVNGQMQVEKVTIAPEAVDPQDIQMLQDLVLAAVTDALDRLKDKIREEVSQATGMLGLPPGFLGL